LAYQFSCSGDAKKVEGLIWFLKKEVDFQISLKQITLCCCTLPQVSSDVPAIFNLLTTTIPLPGCHLAG